MDNHFISQTGPEDFDYPILSDPCPSSAVVKQRANRKDVPKKFVDYNEEINVILGSFDWAFFVEMNFFLSINKPAEAEVEDDSPLSLTRLRPKEVSIVRIWGNPNHRHYNINYDPHDGKQNLKVNDYIKSLGHGLFWKTTGGTCNKINNFLSDIDGLVYRFGEESQSQAKLYTSDPTTRFYLAEVCGFQCVTLLEKKETDFDPWIMDCGHHSGVDISSRPCTENRVWMLRHVYGRKLTTTF